MSDLRSIIQTPFVIVGGIATRLYMPERMTDDLDILILADNSGRLYGELEQAGREWVGELMIGGSSWRLSDGTILNVREFEQAWVAEAIANPNFSPDGLPVIGLPYLVLMKLQASRVQDLADVSRMLGGADEEMLNSVRSLVGVYLSDASEDLESLITLGRLEMGDES
ncbi:hypothetical protein NEA10_09485 [Phormidium yuhuli AB48]|uniref:Uncharacterized protein n=1 Tax=Phormidium yuhuli AB48 TaxID=2940671 RepID=A0ABY5AUK1_9CYAN|nr:hypothetical protein [Phormidium yuhuli]USR92923.1 hypothetical protein NEA10_09485 [Phormidium yuhuli AB48]